MHRQLLQKSKMAAQQTEVIFGHHKRVFRRAHFQSVHLDRSHSHLLPQIYTSRQRLFPKSAQKSGKCLK